MLRLVPARAPALASAAAAPRGVAYGRGRRRPLVPLALLGLLIWLASAPTVHALVVYRWIEPDGTVAYGQMPPGARDGSAVRRVSLPPPPAPEGAGRPHAPAAGSSVMDAPDGPNAAAAVDTPNKPDAPDTSARLAPRSVDDAWRQLQIAEDALRQGKTPRSGDRRHLVDGHSRLTGAYFDRVSALEAAVQRARENLQAAYAARAAAGGTG